MIMMSPHSRMIPHKGDQASGTCLCEKLASVSGRQWLFAINWFHDELVVVVVHMSIDDNFTL